MDSLVQEKYAHAGSDLHGLLARLAAKRWWIVASVLVFTSASAGAAFLMQPVYRATAVLTSANAERGADLMGFAGSSVGGLASGLGLGLGAKDAETEEALAVLRSREFTESFISSYNLMPKLFAKGWDPTKGTWKADVKVPTLAKAYKYFDTDIRTILEDKKTGFISIQVDWTDRNEAATWANDLVRQLNEEMRSRAITNADASTRFLNKELQSTTTVEGRDAISRLLEAQLKKRMLATVTHDYSFRVVDRALPADKDDRVKPMRGLMIVAGALLGLALPIFAVLVFGSVNRNIRPSGV